MKKKVLIWLAAFLAAISLTACGGSKSEALMETAVASDYIGNYKNEIAMEDTVTQAVPGLSDSADAGLTSGSVADEDKKLIRTVYMNLKVETDLNKAVEAVKALINNSGGYIEQNNSYYGSYSSNVNMKLRVPKASSDKLIDELKNSYKLIRIDDSVEDVTLNYTDVKTRLEVKRKTREKYIEYLDRAETIEDIMAIEDKISAVTADIEAFEAKLRVMDNQIDYTTIHLELQSDEKVVEKSFIEKLQQQFKDFSENILEIFLNMLEWSAYALIVLAFVIPLIGLAIKLFMRIVRGKREKKSRGGKNTKSEPGNKSLFGKNTDGNDSSDNSADSVSDKNSPGK